ncbi:ubiquitin thiolesterase [[Emmonsia] crescens]|uniref:ubiquitinyl hydrolase 1 n=1 Tax=[Emmonsia] crescens TaxID=73230 RepID=A0A0G2I8A7_9EURO|nr:ubiquitin thiolesterase [Emmonsia crescens UAMH 3008]
MPGPSDSSSYYHHHHRLYTTPLKDSYRDDRFDEWIPGRSKIVYFGLSVLLGYYIFKYLDPITSTLFQTAWNIIVFFTPSRIILALDKEGASDQDTELDATSSLTRSARHAAKSVAMQRILGLDANSFLTTFPRGRSLSGIGQAFLGLKEPFPPGLGNWDYSCYQNSIIQGFASLRTLHKFLEANLRELGDRDPFYTHIALKEIIDKLNSPSYGGRQLWMPPELKSMSSWQQQDAQEYFSKVVDQVDKEIRRASRGLTSDAGLRFVDTERSGHKVGLFPAYERRQVNDELKAPGYGEYTCSFRNPLEGLLAQRVGCMRCGWTEGLSLIPFNCLTVPLGTNWEYDIRECLDEYTTLEPIEGVECAKCTLLRTQGQLEQLLKQIDSDAELGEGTSTPRLTEALRCSAETRLKVVQAALENEDFSEKTLSEKCHIPARNRVSSTKSRQAVIARAPKSLVIHVNRSVFNEMTGVLRKNYADVKFPRVLDLGDWCLGSKSAGETDEVAEFWGINPSESMLSRPGTNPETPHRRYELRAVITHYGRHENGHYICYRKYSAESFPATVTQAVIDADREKESAEHWFRLSDENVGLVSESDVLSQGGVFMLFYEYIDEPRDTATGAVDQEQPGQEGIPLQEISFNSQGGEPGGILRSRNVDVDKTEKTENRPDSSGTSTGFATGHSSPDSDLSDTTSSSFSSENGSTVADKIQPAPAMKTAVTPFESNQETHSDVHVGAGASMVQAL